MAEAGEHEVLRGAPAGEPVRDPAQVSEERPAGMVDVLRPMSDEETLGVCASVHSQSLAFCPADGRV